MTRTAIATFMQICRIIVLIMVQMTIVASVSFYLAIKYSLNFCCSPSKPNVMGSPQIVVESSTMHWLMIWHSFNFHAIEAFHNYSYNSTQWKHGLFDLSNQLRKVFLRLELVLWGIRADSDLVKLCREKELQDGLPYVDNAMQCIQNCWQWITIMSHVARPQKPLTQVWCKFQQSAASTRIMDRVARWENVKEPWG